MHFTAQKYTPSHPSLFQFQSSTKTQLNKNTSTQCWWDGIIPKWCVALQHVKHKNTNALVWNTQYTFSYHTTKLTGPFDEHNYAKGSVRHSSGCWPRWCGCSGPPGPVSRIRYGGPWHPSVMPVAQLRSHLSSRSQYVCCGSSRSSTTYLVCGVPQGSVLGPFLFVLYTAGLISLKAMVCHHTSMPLVNFWRRSLGVQLLALAGWGPTGYSWTPTKRKFCGLWYTIGPQQHNGDWWYSFFHIIIRLQPWNTHWRQSAIRMHVQKTVSCCFAILCQMRQINCSMLSATANIPVTGGHSGEVSARLR